jgi:hypothetical protein
MNASFLDLRKRSREILGALERNETITLFYRGKPKAVITPLEEAETPKFEELPAFGIWADRDDMADPAAYVRELRQGRYRDL